MKYFSVRAVILATLAVMGIDIISGLVLAAVFGGPILDAQLSDEELRAAAQALAGEPGYVAGALILGTASSVVGGFLVARLAGALPYFNALAFGALGTLLGILTSGDFPLWLRVIGVGLTIPAALLGAFLHKQKSAQRSR